MQCAVLYPTGCSGQWKLVFLRHLLAHMAATIVSVLSPQLKKLIIYPERFVLCFQELLCNCWYKSCCVQPGKWKCLHIIFQVLYLKLFLCIIDWLIFRNCLLLYFCPVTFSRRNFFLSFLYSEGSPGFCCLAEQSIYATVHFF